MTRNSRIDIAKGSLIVLVIAGHLLPGEYRASLARWIIYSFHIPLFVAVSGYLFPWNKMGQCSLAAVIRKYWRRPLLPWLTALIVYALIDTAPGFWRHFFPPFFHLWFIAAYLFWVLLSWTLLRFRLSLPQILAVGGLIAVVCVGLHWRYTVRPDYYVFFVLGGFLRNRKVAIPVSFAVPPSLLFLTGEVLLFYFPSDWLEPLCFYGLNFCLIGLLVAFIEARRVIHQPALEWIGVHSLAIYLWHVIPLIIVFRLQPANVWQANGLNALFLAVFFGIVWMTTQLPASSLRRTPR